MRKSDRMGAALVEFAVVSPVFLLLIFGMIEFGRVIMVQQLLTNAAREGARMATFDGVKLKDVTKEVNDYAPTLSPEIHCDPAPGTAKYGELQTVTLTLPAEQVSWLVPLFYKASIVASASMMRETVPD